MAPAAVQSFFEANSGKTDLSKNHVSPSHRDHEEYQYLDLIRDILDCGEHRPDRYEIESIANLAFTDDKGE